MFHILVVVALIGLVDWAVQTLVPMTDKFKQIIHVVAVIGAVLTVLNGTGLLAGHLEM